MEQETIVHASVRHCFESKELFCKPVCVALCIVVCVLYFRIKNHSLPKKSKTRNALFFPFRTTSEREREQTCPFSAMGAERKEDSKQAQCERAREKRNSSLNFRSTGRG